MKIYILISTLVLLAGCGTPQPTKVWYKPGVTPEQTRQDLDTARAYARSEPTSFAGMVSYMNIYMGNHGYVLVTTNELEKLKAGPLNSHGLSLKDAREKSLALNPGMTQNEVNNLLGKPDDTGARTFGQKTKTGEWQGIQWFYQFETDNSITILTINFQQSDIWRINSWDWYPN